MFALVASANSVADACEDEESRIIIEDENVALAYVELTGDSENTQFA